MRVRYFYFLSLLLTFSFACSDNSKIDPLLEEAFAIHEQSIIVKKEAQEILESLPSSDNFRKEADSRLKTWSKQLPEVPGFEHDHSHHDHEHDHGPKLELTPEDMLIVQKEMLDSVKVMKERILHYKENLVPVQ